jgi:predicted nucleic acid-binding Zn ribbon protein
MAKCAQCKSIVFGGVKANGKEFCNQTCRQAYTPPANSVTCGKCGTNNPLDGLKCNECGEYLHQFKQGLNVFKCPMCSEAISPDSSVCPHCKHAIFSNNKQTNAVVSILVSVVSFIVLYYAINAFVHYQAEQDMKVIRQQAQQETQELMNQTQQMLNNLK